MIKVFNKLEEKLKSLEIDEEKINELVQFAKDETAKDFIPKEKYNEKTSALEVADEKIQQYEEKAAKVDELIKEKAELKDQVTEIENTYKQKIQEVEGNYESKLKMSKKTSILKDSLIQNGADPENVDLLLHEFDGKIEEMKLNDDGNDIIGKDDYLTPVKERRNKFFKKIENNTGKPPSGGTGEKSKADMTPDERLQANLKAKGLI